MGMRLPLPPPRNRDELEEQIRILQTRIALNGLFALVLLGTASIGMVAFAFWSMLN